MKHLQHAAYIPSVAAVCARNTYESKLGKLLQTLQIQISSKQSGAAVQQCKQTHWERNTAQKTGALKPPQAASNQMLCACLQQHEMSAEA
jgi:hypothetical protein